MARTGPRERINKEEYDYIVAALDRGENAYSIYRAQMEAGSNRSTSFWGRWVKRIKAGQKFEDYGKKNFIPEITGYGEKSSNETTKITPKHYTPTINHGKFGLDLQAFGEASVLIAQETLNVIVRVAELETEKATMQTQIRDLQKTVQGLYSEISDLKVQLAGDTRAVEVVEAFNSEIKEIVETKIMQGLNALNPRITELMKAGDIVPERQPS